MNQPTTPNTVEDFLPLPEPSVNFCQIAAYTDEDMRAYVLADRAQRSLSNDIRRQALEIIAVGDSQNPRATAEAALVSSGDWNAQPEQPASPTVAGSVDTPEFRDLAEDVVLSGFAHVAIQRLADYFARLAPAAPTDAQPDDHEPVAWLVFAEDTCTPGSPMFPQHPAVPTKKQAEIYASTFGQTHVEVRPLFDRKSTAAQSVRDAAQPTGSRQCGKCKRVSDIVELEKHCPFCQPTIAPGKDKP